MHISNPENISLSKNEYCSVAGLEDIVKEHPYYAIAHFRLLVKYNQIKSEHFDRQASLTALFFKNHRWLNYQLARQENPIKPGAYNIEPDFSVTELSDDEVTAETVALKKRDQPLAFEPMHLVDYFASQGIKINDELVRDDKLGAQLKSFTEWLKSMKKIHADKMPDGDEQTDKKIRNLAESSNTHILVITEAMAEVLLKQGKVAQAIEMYQKLSLNYPSENAYFAGKIKSLNSV